MLKTFRNDEGLERGSCLAVGDHAGILTEGLHRGLWNLIHHVEVARQHVGVSGILIRVDAVFDAFVGHLAAALIILVWYDDDVLVVGPGLELVRTIANRSLAELLDVLKCHAWQREHGLVRELGREYGIRLVQLDDQRVVVRGGKTGKCGLRIDVRILQFVIALDGGESACGLLRVLHVGGETPGVGEGMGGYRLAVGELPAFLQLDCVLGGILVRGDTLGDFEMLLALCVEAHQTFEQVSNNSAAAHFVGVAWN